MRACLVRTIDVARRWFHRMELEIKSVLPDARTVNFEAH